MDRARFRDWVSSIDELTATQRREAAAVLSDPPEGEASLAAIELGVGEERRCPHCTARSGGWPLSHPAEARREQREAGTGVGDRPGRPARLRRRALPSARCCGARHSRESVNRSAGERVRGAVHIQTATSRHIQIKGFLRRFRGIATKCLDSCPRWFHLVVLGRHPSPRACLEAASARSCLRFAN